PPDVRARRLPCPRNREGASASESGSSRSESSDEGGATAAVMTATLLPLRDVYVEALRLGRCGELIIRGDERTATRTIPDCDEGGAELESIGSGQRVNPERSLGTLTHPVEGGDLAPASREKVEAPE